MENILFKALNPDDDSEVVQLTQLFRRAYGASFPLPPVYEIRFWKNHAGNRFSSLLAVHGRKVIAHLAVRPDRDNRAHVQIYLPVCDPEFISLHQTIHRQMLEIVAKQGLRRGWKMFYCYVIDDIAQMHFFADEVLNSSEVAVWPNALASSDRGDFGEPLGRRHVLVTQKMLTQQIGESDRAPLYAPEQHRRICEWLYTSIGIKKTVVAGSKPRGARRSQLLDTRGMSALPADQRALDTRSYRQIGVKLTYIEPSLLPSFRKLRGELNDGVSAHYVHVNMYDSATPACCASLEESGYGFCGISPFHHNKESIVYSNQRLEPVSMARTAVSSYILGRYMEKYSFADVEPLTLRAIERLESRAGSSA